MAIFWRCWHNLTIPPTVISSVVSASGLLVSSLPDILETFRQYYSFLYTPVLPSDFQPQDLAFWLDPLALSLSIGTLSLVEPMAPEGGIEGDWILPVGEVSGSRWPYHTVL